MERARNLLPAFGDTVAKLEGKFDFLEGVLKDRTINLKQSSGIQGESAPQSQLDSLGVD